MEPGNPAMAASVPVQYETHSPKPPAGVTPAHRTKPRRRRHSSFSPDAGSGRSVRRRPHQFFCIAGALARTLRRIGTRHITFAKIPRRIARNIAPTDTLSLRGDLAF